MANFGDLRAGERGEGLVAQLATCCGALPSGWFLGKNLALAASQAAHAHCMVIEALPLSASDEQVRAAIRPFSRAGLPLATEAAEVRALQRELGWRGVQRAGRTGLHRAWSVPRPVHLF